MQLGLSTAYGHHCCLAFYTDCQSVCHSIWEYWTSPKFNFKGTSHAFWYHNRKSMSSRFNVLSGSCLTAGGHPASFINQVCIMLVNFFVIHDGIMNGAGLEAWACAFLCFRAHNKIMCSSGVHLLPFLALAIGRASLNSGLLREHVCCHMFPPACVFPSGLGNISVTKMGGGYPSPMEGQSSMWAGVLWAVWLSALLLM